MEAGTHSPWISRLLEAAGHRVIVANPRKVRAIYTADNKTDRKDAEMLARMVARLPNKRAPSSSPLRHLCTLVLRARMDAKLLYPIRHGSEASQKAFMILKSRDALVRSRVSLINGVRSLLKSIGMILPSGWSAACFARKAREHLDDDHTRLVDAMLECILVHTEEIRLLDKRITAMIEDTYPDAQRLQSVGGVGPITALAFILTVDDPDRFNKARDIGPFLGMTPRRDQSGDCDKQLPITKAGNAMLRRLLVNCATGGSVKSRTPMGWLWFHSNSCRNFYQVFRHVTDAPVVALTCCEERDLWDMDEGLQIRFPKIG